MDIQQIKYFLALAKELHFWNTSRNMNITQSALSRSIQSLESELGVLLFERNKRNVKLTPAGKFLQEKWEDELNKLQLIHQSAQQIHLGEIGKIRIAYPDSVSASILPDIVQRITSNYPKLKIEPVPLVSGDLEEFLKNYKIDLALTRDINKFQDINSEKLHVDHLAFVVAENHPVKTIEDISTELLSTQKFILSIEEQNSSYNQIVKSMFDFYKIVPDVQIFSESGSTIMALVRQGLGVAILPNSYRYYNAPGIRFVNLPFESALYVNWRTFDYNPLLSNILKLIVP